MSTKESPIWAITCLVVAVITLSFSPILTRITENELGPYATTFNRFWIASLALILGSGVKILWDKQNERLPTTKEAYTIQDFFYLFLIASFDSACLVTWAWSLTKTTVANSNLLHNTTPIFAILGGWLLLSQYVNRRFLIGTSLALGGTLIIAFQDFHLAQDTLIGDSIALLSALFYAGVLLVTEHLRIKFETTTILIWNCSLSCLLLLPCTLLFEDRLFPVSFSGWLAVIALGLFCTLIGVGALFYTLEQFSSGFVSVMMLLEPIIAAFLAWAIFGERLSFLDGLTFVVVLSGIYLIKSDWSLDDSSSL
ncbi:DMT family transporter [Aerosakkonema funiforme]|uniref:DMT family transporter n=1 Tax=Aerosakkonema funiforme FACHB-1375 TaxID=2949571 RepID=A0A926ZE42_9CYAN|nr:EamA family transporter [Aerosakkonema funiforme]MBD2179678.1 DMT family transporter [Aerosakkonema funiforme FACHB-1375]